MHNPSKLRDITAQMRYLLTQICGERPEYLELRDEVLSDEARLEYGKNINKNDLKKYAKWLKNSKENWEAMQSGMYSQYAKFATLNQERKKLMCRTRVKQIKLAL